MVRKWPSLNKVSGLVIEFLLREEEEIWDVFCYSINSCILVEPKIVFTRVQDPRHQKSCLRRQMGLPVFEEVVPQGEARIHPKVIGYIPVEYHKVWFLFPQLSKNNSCLWIVSNVADLSNPELSSPFLERARESSKFVDIPEPLYPEFVSVI